MGWVVKLNYQHLRYFWVVARNQSLTRGARELHLTPQTVSGQLKLLEQALGTNLFRRAGRGLAITEAGEVAFRFAEEIFGLGRELVETLQGEAIDRPLRIRVGIVDVLPKLVAQRLLVPATRLQQPVRLVCAEAPAEQLLADLALHKLDVVLSDVPIPPWVKIRAYNHPLGESGVVFLGAPPLAEKYRGSFPGALEHAPVLLPMEGTALRSSLEQWFKNTGVRPRVVGEFEDSALMKSFGQEGAGLFPVPAVIEIEVAAQYRVERVGWADGVIERFFAISVERRVRHPGVAAICEAAREELFAEDRPQGASDES